jgi:hypothetical protein
MFYDVFAELSSLQTIFSESVRDELGMSFVNEVLEPIIRETNSLVLMHEEIESLLINIESLRSEIATIRRLHHT